MTDGQRTYIDESYHIKIAKEECTGRLEMIKIYISFSCIYHLIFKVACIYLVRVASSNSVVSQRGFFYVPPPFAHFCCAAR